MELIMPIMMLAGIAGSMTSGALSAQASMEAAKATMKVARRSAAVTEANFETKARIAEREQRRQLGRITSKMVASGIDPFSGTPLGISSQQAGEFAFEAGQIRRAGSEQAWGIMAGARISAAQMRAQAGATVLGTVGTALQSTAMYGAMGGFEAFGGAGVDPGSLMHVWRPS